MIPSIVAGISCNLVFRMLCGLPQKPIWDFESSEAFTLMAPYKMVILCFKLGYTQVYRGCGSSMFAWLINAYNATRII